MPRQARGEYVNPDEVPILHLVNRCVRRAFMCGDDPFTGKSFEHRREWTRDRLEFLASIFGIDCLTYTVMSNHSYLILRSRPDIVQEWSDREVARRWLRLFPIRLEEDGSPAEPEDFEISMITKKQKETVRDSHATFGRQLVDALYGRKYRSTQQQRGSVYRSILEASGILQPSSSFDELAEGGNSFETKQLHQQL